MGFVKEFLVISLTVDEFLKERETLYPFLPSINRTFWRPENEFLKWSRDPRHKTCSDFWWPENEIFQGFWDSWLTNTCLPLSKFSLFWRPEKTIPAVSLNPPLQGNWFHVIHCSTLWEHENVILQGFYKMPCILGMWVSRRFRNGIFRPSKCRICAPQYPFPWSGGFHEM